MLNSRNVVRFFVVMALATAAWAQTAAKFDSATVSGLPARNIGSAQMSGRISALDAINQNGKTTVFVGSASGGVWKSINGGVTFKPVFDKQPVQSIGAVAIDTKDPRNVWVGTGESWTRNSVSIGDGIYKSTDGGENWTNVGLRESERISRIVIDPNDSNHVLACVVGALWSDSTERGVYKTRDGGKTWKKVLAGANPSTGCGMMTAAPDGRTMFASLWDFRRQGWTFRSGGPGSAIMKSTDGGDTWSPIDESSATGLPAKPWGRIALAVAPSRPQTVYAMIESKASALYRSDDGGKTWAKKDSSQFMVWRPFYFAHLIVDPKNPEKLFKPDLPLLMSTNGGQSFTNVQSSSHGDFHDVWIDPTNTNVVFAGDDGGMWRSEDGGSRWRHLLNLPLSQFYHVSVDMADPYRVYGGLQDNSSWVGHSSYPGGVTNAQWENMYGGDGFWMFEDPADPNYIYAESQGGYLGRIHRHTHEVRSVQPLAEPGEKKLRYNWNTPIHLSPNDKGTIYIGAQYLYRSRNQGQTWEKISPDLTTNDPEKQRQEESGGITIDNSAAEMHTSIYSISESPRNRNIIWVGTDDGNLQLTRDGGKTWTNVAPNAAGLPKHSWVSWVEASRFNEGTAYATFDRHTFGDMAPYAYRTTDFGATWTPLLARDSGVRGYVHVIKEDPVSPNLLFLGTEFGLWISADGGARWAEYKGSGFPSVAVRDIVIHPREHDLVLGTHGRGIWIVDDISPLRALAADTLTKELAFVPGRPAIQYIQAQGGWPEGDDSFTGPSRPTGAPITYYQRARHIFGDLKIEILDAEGKVLDTVEGGKRRGLNRATWSMRLKPPRVPPAATAMYGVNAGPRVLPGDYTVRLTKGEQTYTTKLRVVPDPRAKHTPEDRRAQFTLAMRLYDQLGRMTDTVESMVALRDAANARAASLTPNDKLRAQLLGLANDVDALRSRIVATKEGGAITGEERIREHVGQLYGDVVQYEGRPTDTQVARADTLARQIDEVTKQFQALTASRLPAINGDLGKRKLQPLK